MGQALQRAIAHVQINTADEFAVTARGDEECIAHLNRVRQRIMGVTCQDHINSRYIAGELAVCVKAIVRQ